MTKRHVDIDDNLLERVQTYYGTTSIKNTVNQALKEVVKMIVKNDAIDYWIAEQKLRDYEEMDREMLEELDILSTQAHSNECICRQSATPSGDYSIEEGSLPAP